MTSTRLQASRVAVVGAALADGTTEQVRPDVTVVIERGRISGMWFDGAAPDVSDLNMTVVDGSGTTLVPGMVDSHAHLSMPGGARWIERGVLDATDELLTVGEENGEALVRAGVRWVRDVGAPQRRLANGRHRPLNLVLRDRWLGLPTRPYVRAAGSWIGADGALPPGLAIEVAHAGNLIHAVGEQLNQGADLVKLYLDGPDRHIAPFSIDEVQAVVALAHERGARVAAHASSLSGAVVAANAAVDSVEHGFVLDRSTAERLAANHVTLVSTLAVLHSVQSFRTTTTIERFASDANVSAIAERRECAEESVRLARDAGVAIAAGSDFGGGSLRANQLAWEVEALVAAGIEPHQALAAVTWRGGDLYGDRDAGRIRVGGPAHFSLVHGDPLVDPSALWRIWLTR